MAGEKLTVGELVYKISGDMDNLKTELKKAEAEVSNLKSAMEKTSASTNAMGKQTESTSVSVFKGVLAYEALKVGIQKVGQFLGASIKESADASRQLAQVKINVENAGFSYDKLASSIANTSEKALQLGFDDDVAGESLSKLLLVTKDMAQAQSLFALSMDLSRAKNISLEEATRAVTLVTQGNSRSLKELGVDVSETASIVDQLTEAQDKLKGSAVAFADTTAGKLEIQRQKWANIQQAVGDRLQPVLFKFFAFVENNQDSINTLMEAFVGTLEVLIFTGGKLVQTFNVIYNSLKAVAGLVEASIVARFIPLVFVLEKLGIVGEGTTKMVKDMTSSMLAFSKESGDKATKALSVLTGATEDTNTSVVKLGTSLVSTSGGFSGIGKGAKATIQSVEEAKKALDEFKNKMIGVIEKAQDVRKALEKDLGESFKKFATSIKENAEETVTTLGKMVVDAGAKITELNKQIADENTSLTKKVTDIQSQKGDNTKQVQDAKELSVERIKVLQDEVKQNQSILDARVGFELRQAEVIKGIRKQLADANIDGSKIGLDALLNTKTLEQQIEENKKNALLNEFQLFEQRQTLKLQTLTTALITEVNLLKGKIETEKKYEAELTAYLQSEQSKRLKGTEAWAKGMIAKYKDVSDSLQTFLTLQSRVSGLNSQIALPNNATSSASVPQTVSSATTNNKTVNAPVTINATTTSNIDFTAIARDFGFLLSKQ